jgi:hypothetical protein
MWQIQYDFFSALRWLVGTAFALGSVGGAHSNESRAVDYGVGRWDLGGWPEQFIDHGLCLIFRIFFSC